jgi:hypothetical protein
MVCVGMIQKPQHHVWVKFCGTSHETGHFFHNWEIFKWNTKTYKQPNLILIQFLQKITKSATLLQQINSSTLLYQQFKYLGTPLLTQWQLCSLSIVANLDYYQELSNRAQK